MTSLYKHIPNIISIIRALLTAALISLFFIDHSVHLAQFIIVAGVISDKLDGTLARLWKVESDLGKRLESLVDPFFGFSAIVYTLTYLGLPLYPFIVGAVLTILGMLGRLFIWFKTKQLFYEKSPLTRYAVGVTYVILLLYFFEVPHREWILWPTIVYGYVVFGNYCRMMALFMKRQSKPTVST